MKRAAIGLLLLLLFGAARLPLEVHLTQLQRAAGFRTANLDLPLRQQVGQLGFVAALSGFRSLVAAVLWIEAHNAWQKVEWGRMAGLLQTVTTLQPKSALYWDLSAWHMAWNASLYALENQKAQPSEALRRRDQQRYFELGRKFYENGLAANPDSGELWARYGDLLRQKFEDHAAAAHAYQEAAKKADARPFYERLAGYELARIPGREREAYDLLRSLYEKGPSERQPSLVTALTKLEEKLGIPPEQRIKETPAPAP